MLVGECVLFFINGRDSLYNKNAVSFCWESFFYYLCRLIENLFLVDRYAEDDYDTRPDGQRQDVAGGGTGLSTAP